MTWSLSTSVGVLSSSPEIPTERLTPVPTAAQGILPIILCQRPVDCQGNVQTELLKPPLTHPITKLLNPPPTTSAQKYNNSSSCLLPLPLLSQPEWRGQGRLLGLSHIEESQLAIEGRTQQDRLLRGVPLHLEAKRSRERTSERPLKVAGTSRSWSYNTRLVGPNCKTGSNGTGTSRSWWRNPEICWVHHSSESSTYQQSRELRGAGSEPFGRRLGCPVVTSTARWDEP